MEFWTESGNCIFSTVSNQLKRRSPPLTSFKEIRWSLKALNRVHRIHSFLLSRQLKSWFPIFVFILYACHHSPLLIRNCSWILTTHKKGKKKSAKPLWKQKSGKNGILLPKLFWPTVRKNCSSDREKLLKFEAEVREFSNC